MLHEIKVRCLIKGISLRSACEQAGICYESIFTWNNHSPSVDKVAKIAKVLGCTIDELVND